MIQKWEIYNWCTNQRVQLCSSESVAQRLLPSHGKSHIIREVWLYDDGMLISGVAQVRNNIQKKTKIWTAKPT